jgi:hypothetical protein
MEEIYEVTETVEQSVEKPTLSTEVKHLLVELRSNNLNGNEIIAILTAERDEYKLQLEEVRDTLLEMLTREESEAETEHEENITI